MFCNSTLLKLSSPCILILFYFILIEFYWGGSGLCGYLKKKLPSGTWLYQSWVVCYFFKKRKMILLKSSYWVPLVPFFFPKKKKKATQSFSCCTFSSIIFNFITDINITYFIVIPVIIFLTSYLFHFLECNCARPTKIH